MSDDATPRLGLPYLAASQAQKHITLNEGLSLLDGLVQTAVQSRTMAIQPLSPLDGALYILPAGSTGSAWAGHIAGSVMRFEASAWVALTPSAGWLALVADEAKLIVYTGTDWVELSSLVSSLAYLSGLGVNAAPDGVNKLSVKSSAVLFDNIGADLQMKIDKASSADSGSILFQTNYSGRGEVGLCGDDDLHFRVSTDGSAFADAIVVKVDTGRIGIGTSSPTSLLQVDGCVRVKIFTKVALPAAADQGAGAITFVSDEIGGFTMAFSDGTNWLRVADRNVVS